MCNDEIDDRSAKLGLMGVTVLYSSGDSGVAGQLTRSSKYKKDTDSTKGMITYVLMTMVRSLSSTTLPDIAEASDRLRNVSREAFQSVVSQQLPLGH